MVDSKVFNYEISDNFQFFEEVSLKGEKKFYVEGYASTTDPDLSGEVVKMSAQQDICNQILNRTITCDIEHDQWYDENGKVLQKPKNEKIPVAKIVHAEMRPKGAWIKAEINQNLYSFKQVWGSIKDGFLKAFSVAFYPIKKSQNMIENLNLVNITLTGSPVNTGATFTATMKSATAWMNQNNQNEEIQKMEEIKQPEAVVVPEIKAEPVKVEDVPAVDVQAIIKAMKEKQDAEMEEMKKQIADLKAELAKPVMKAQVEKVMPESKPVMMAVSPLQLVK